MIQKIKAKSLTSSSHVFVRAVRGRPLLRCQSTLLLLSFTRSHQISVSATHIPAPVPHLPRNTSSNWHLAPHSFIQTSLTLREKLIGSELTRPHHCMERLQARRQTMSCWE